MGNRKYDGFMPLREHVKSLAGSSGVQPAFSLARHDVYFLLFAFCLLLFLAGCATKWDLRTEQSEIALQWPYQPATAKATYLMAMSGVERSSSTGSVMRAIVYGGTGDDINAFMLPVSVVTGSDGRIAVADTGCRCVRLYIPNEKRYLEVTAARDEELRSPVSVAFDDELRLYVSDSAIGKVFVFGSDGTFLSSLHRAGSGHLKRPTGLAYNLSRKLLYVVDTFENRVYAFDAKGESVFSFGGRGEDAGLFNFPTHIFWSPQGILYVTDSLNFRIQIFDDSGGYLDSFGKHGDGSGDFAMPKGVAVDKSGIIYVVDGLFDNIQLFNGKGEFLLTIGRRGTDFGEFWLPSGIFIDTGGILYVCDTYNRRIQLFRVNENYGNGNRVNESYDNGKL